ncbi:NADH:ubiquinone oxidoreductase [Tropilaelaps mercedesae]|uniref:NADH:ubiquinone oxidoreductase n=1 Tax=Tropilaelaps mercedesae TaxID=418985 RepID=A0A1V9XF29_9ACAR|nr:NADH:ubiquinone oxidoreductase [Tropilaelaps mercedesae]
MSTRTNLPCSDTGGVKPMNIEGRFGQERARLSGEFSDAERAWRKQWLKDQLCGIFAQILAPDEPRYVPELRESCRNPIRRFYQYPFEKFEAALVPKIGKNKAFLARFFTSRFISTYVLVLYFTYWGQYNQSDWTRTGGLMITRAGRDVLPCHTDYPKVSGNTKPSDYADKGFSQRKVFLDL